ncbi:MAG: DUF2493 domain-containing protein [Gammaproteobacteria bacterium]|nr:DUF2493 domain-containing protein [Gammaproteobacteria bacterium]
MSQVKLIVTGTKTFENKKLVIQVLNDMKSKISELEVVTGADKGPETMAAEWAEYNNTPSKIFKVNWKDINVEGADVAEGPYGKYNRKAGVARNREMVEYGTHLLAFWDGEDIGTKILIEFAKKANLKIKIFIIEGDNIRPQEDEQPEVELKAEATMDDDDDLGF